jgi:glycosyltransferase involved in cell wall biosynthesis
MLEKITPLILTYNEEPNIDRTLQQLRWAKEIIVIDSYSTDRTLDILKSKVDPAKYCQNIVKSS